jgi:hypothetical protein
MPLYKVETISQFRMVYFIEAKELEHAFDEVTMRDAYDTDDSRFFDESAQDHIGEVIVCGDEVTHDQFNAWLDKNKKISSHWMRDRLIHKIDYADTDEEHISRNVFKNMGSSMIMGRPDNGAQ